MTATSIRSFVQVGSNGRRPPPLRERGLWAKARQNFFSSWSSCAATVFFIVLLALFILPFVRWAVVNAVWYTQDSQVCRTTGGACWAVVPEKIRVMLFGTYPPSERWRGVLAVAVIVALSIASCISRFWSLRLFYVWIAATGVVLTLMFGGVLGLRAVPTHDWGGLPLTMLLFIGTVVAGLPLAVFLALGRRSQLPIIKAMSIGYIEIVRGLPLIAVLFMASVLFPLFVPEAMTVDKLLRAQIGMILFFGAYAAEVVRGGLQAIPRGQYEAADAIGLTYWQATRSVVLPQALRIVIPGLMNDIIRAFKNTTFVSIVGLFDVLGATKAALQDLRWINYSTEAYIFMFALYFVFCFSMSRYSQHIEARLAEGKRY